MNGAVHSNGISHAPAEVDCTPVLTRLAASPACRLPAQQHLRSFEGRLAADCTPLDSVCLWLPCAALQLLLHFRLAYRCSSVMCEICVDHKVQASQSSLTKCAALSMLCLIFMARCAVLIVVQAWQGKCSIGGVMTVMSKLTSQNSCINWRLGSSKRTTGQTEDQLQHDHYLGAPFLLQLYNRAHVLQCKPDSNKDCCVIMASLLISAA